MTTIITRLYSDAGTAGSVAKALLEGGLVPDTIDVITDEGAADRMRAARVSKDAAAAYGKAMTGGRALLVVRAPFAPIGTARRALRIVGQHPSIDVGLANEDEYIREEPRTETMNRVLQDHPFFMSNPHSRTMHGHIFGKPLRQRRAHISAIRGGAYMSTRFWPMKLLSGRRNTTSARRTGWLFSSMLGIPTTIER